MSAWQAAIERRSGPTALVLSRQNLAHQDRDAEQFKAIDQGGYILFEPATTPVAILIATGSEVEIARQAALTLTAGGQPTRLVSMPCAEVFAAQSASYQQQVLPQEMRIRVAVEAGHGDIGGSGWDWMARS